MSKLFNRKKNNKNLNIFKEEFLTDTREALPELVEKKLPELEMPNNDISDREENNRRESIVKQSMEEELSLEELETQERIRQRKEFAKAQLDRKRADREQFIKSFKNPMNLVSYVAFVGVSFLYLNYLSNVAIAATIISLLGSVWLSYWFVYKPSLLAVEQQELMDLTDLASQINFHMQNGKNVADTLEYIKDNYGGRVGSDVNYTYTKLMADGELITSNFERYNFTSFNVFTRNLQIAYHDGADPKKLFKFPLNNINFEWIERQNLDMKNKSQRNQEFMGLAISALIPCALRLVANKVYMDFLGYPLVAVILSTIVYFGFIKIMTSVQKLRLDISVSL